jgi:hypothetical protein
MKALRALGRVAVLAVAASISCGKHGSHGDSSPLPAPGGVESYAPKGSAPPVVVTFNIVFAENVTLTAMQAIAAKFEAANNSLWNVTESQIRIGRLRISDNAHPGSNSNQYAQLTLSAEDVCVWSTGAFNGPGIAYTLVGDGRFGRFMGIPTNIQNNTLIHELGHFLFELTWSVAPVLIDEYEDPPDDPACIMELTYSPLRWCSVTNHLDQPGQPHSCWTQILADYPAFTYTNTNVAAAPPPAPDVEYTDTP